MRMLLISKENPAPKSPRPYWWPEHCFLNQSIATTQFQQSHELSSTRPTLRHLSWKRLRLRLHGGKHLWRPRCARQGDHCSAGRHSLNRRHHTSQKVCHLRKGIHYHLHLWMVGSQKFTKNCFNGHWASVDSLRPGHCTHLLLHGHLLHHHPRRNIFGARPDDWGSWCALGSWVPLTRPPYRLTSLKWRWSKNERFGGQIYAKTSRLSDKSIPFVRQPKTWTPNVSRLIHCP